MSLKNMHPTHLGLEISQALDKHTWVLVPPQQAATSFHSSLRQ